MTPSLDRRPGTGEPGGRAAAHDVLVHPSPLVRAGVEILRAQVGTAGDDRLDVGVMQGLLL